MGRDGSGVRAISKTSIEITFTYRGVRCRERLRLVPSPTNLKRAERHRAAILDAIERGSFDYSVTFPDSPRRFIFAEQRGQAQTVADYLDKWVEREATRLKTSTANDYRKSVNILIAKFGKIYLPDLKRPAIREWCSMLTCTNKRLANLQSVLRTALQQAVDDGLIEQNPLYGWKYERKEAPKRADDVDPFTPAEQTAILGQLDGQARNLIQFAFWTGLRTSELVALEWGDVDWKRGVVRVSRAKTQAAEDHEDTKTRAGRREVKLLGLALAALKDQKAYTFLAGKEVFHNPRTEEPWVGDQPIRKTMWEPALRRAGVRYRRPYQTRHTYASMMLTAGESPMWVAQQMGHADWGMIRKIYGRWIPDAVPDAGSKAERLFGGAITNASSIPEMGTESTGGMKK